MQPEYKDSYLHNQSKSTAKRNERTSVKAKLAPIRGSSTANSPSVTRDVRDKMQSGPSKAVSTKSTAAGRIRHRKDSKSGHTAASHNCQFIVTESTVILGGSSHSIVEKYES